MGFVNVPAPRADIRDVPGGLEVSIPARRHVFVVPFLAVRLAGWFEGGNQQKPQLGPPA